MAKIKAIKEFFGFVEETDEKEHMVLKEPHLQIYLPFLLPLDKFAGGTFYAPQRHKIIESQQAGVSNGNKKTQTNSNAPKNDSYHELRAIIMPDPKSNRIAIRVKTSYNRPVKVLITELTGEVVFKEKFHKNNFSFFISGTDKWTKTELKILKIQQFSERLKEPDDQEVTMSRFYRTNRRVTYKLCYPLLNKFVDTIYYCSFAKMPGVWIGSVVSENQKQYLDKKITLDENTGKLVKYSRQQHVVESCLRHLSRSEYENFLGPIIYSLTRYRGLLRISIPYEKNYMIILNARIKYLDFYYDLFQQIWVPTIIPNFIESKESIRKRLKSKISIPSFIPDDDVRANMKNLCIEKEKICTKEKFSQKMYVKDFFTSTPSHPHLRDTFQSYFDPEKRNKVLEVADERISNYLQSIQNLETKCSDYVNKDYRTKYDKLRESLNEFYHQLQDPDLDSVTTHKINLSINNLKKECESYISKNDIEIYKKIMDDISYQYFLIIRETRTKKILENLNSVRGQIRYASMGNVDGIPLFRYVRKDVRLLLNTYDEYELFVETVNLHKMRKSINRFFGPVRFTIAVFAKVAQITIPIGNKHLLILALDINEETKKFLIPKTMENILSFIENDIKKEYVLSDL